MKFRKALRPQLLWDLIKSKGDSCQILIDVLLLADTYCHSMTRNNVMLSEFWLLISYSPVFRPDPKRFCDMGLVAPVEEGLSDVLLGQLQPEDGVDGPGHGWTIVSHHRTVDGQVLPKC